MNHYPKKSIKNRCTIICVATIMLAVFSIASARPPGVVFPDYYPDDFSGVGRIVRIDEKKVVINDELYYLSPRVSYHTLKQEYAFKTDIRPGMLVGYVKESGNVIVSLWFIEK